ncbi:MAG: hypothetical protein ABIY55_36330 [Kofleriaceae bacterium]
MVILPCAMSNHYHAVIYDQDECAAGLVCDHNSMCAATLVDGASCTSNSDRASNGCNLDDQGNATCVPRTTCHGQ